MSLLRFKDFTVEKYTGNLLALTCQLTNVNKESPNKARRLLCDGFSLQGKNGNETISVKFISTISSSNRFRMKTLWIQET